MFWPAVHSLATAAQVNIATQTFTEASRMLPPIDDVILQSNPKFALLHANLTNNILDSNGSTKHHPSQKERDAILPVCAPPVASQ
jgi:hypothetical protein